MTIVLKFFSKPAFTSALNVTFHLPAVIFAVQLQISFSETTVACRVPSVLRDLSPSTVVCCSVYIHQVLLANSISGKVGLSLPDAHKPLPLDRGTLACQEIRK